jgi:hypothetical protein
MANGFSPTPERAHEFYLKQRAKTPAGQPDALETASEFARTAFADRGVAMTLGFGYGATGPGGAT